MSFQENSPTNDAYEALKAAWDASNGPDRAGTLQRGYSNGSTFKLDTLNGKEAPPYVAAHAKHNPYLASVVGPKGYHDAFLLTLGGDCIWSYAKEPEFTSNFVSGPYSQAGLGKAFQASLAEPSKVHTTAFIPWAPSKGAPASFVCTGLYAQNVSLMGVICIQRSSDALDFAGDSRFGEAMADFISGWPEIGSSGARKAYVDTNPYPGSKESLDFAPGPEKYNSVHKKHHAYFRDLVQSKGYYDLMFVDLLGDCVYTLCKEAEFGTNLRTGPYNSTGLANACLRAAQDPDGVTETDFEPYPPSDDALGSFRVTGVRDSLGRLIGFLALQVSAPLMVSLDANGDAIESYAIVNVVSSGDLAKMVPVALCVFEKSKWTYAQCHADRHAQFLCCDVMHVDSDVAGTANCRKRQFGQERKKEYLCQTTFSSSGCSCL